MTYNVDLMLQVREQITAHPETHDQTKWALRTECGTVMCIAGWTEALAGHAMEWRHYDVGEDYAGFSLGPWHAPKYMPDAAQATLGLDSREAGRLFYEINGTKALALLDRFIEAGKNGERVCLD